jgi:hypothetical protein
VNDAVIKRAKIADRKFSKNEDWSVVKTFPGGELGYDFEEGFRFSISARRPQYLVDCVAAIRAVHTAQHIPFTQKTRRGVMHLVHCSPNTTTDTTDALLKTFMKNAGFVYSESDYCYVLPEVKSNDR